MTDQTAASQPHPMQPAVIAIRVCRIGVSLACRPLNANPTDVMAEVAELRKLRTQALQGAAATELDPLCTPTAQNEMYYEIVSQCTKLIEDAVNSL